MAYVGVGWLKMSYGEGGWL